MLCGSNEYRLLYEKENFSIVRCNSCQLAYIYPQPDNEQIKNLYGMNYYDGWGLQDDWDAVHRIKTLTFQKRFEDIEKYISSGKFLDVGCAMGFSLEVAQARNWEPYGVEISEYSSGIAKKKFGSAVFTGSLEKANFKSKSFDVIMMSDLLEHVPDPNIILCEARRILKPGGLIVITTPNITSISSIFMKGNWVNIKFEHLFYFSPTTIKLLLKKNNFEVSKILPATKALNLSYFQTQFNIFKRPLITSAINMLVRILPESLIKYPFYMNAGDMFVIGVRK
jgi:2-polyprenyl-3-methyl-5-hydroxy-6-metoxy-1,4-benzoquinol methylase